MEYGRVDECVSLSRRWREYVERKLPPNPLRAEQLRLLSHETLRNLTAHTERKLPDSLCKLLLVALFPGNIDHLCAV